MLIYSLLNIALWIKDNNKTEELITEINKEYNPSTKDKILDLSYLKKINKDTVGYIIVKNTNISYPFVQAKDNSYYLNHSFDKTYSNAGWLFMDYKNNNFNDQNTIIYAHARIDGTMFGTLKNTIKKNWYKNKDNHIITIILNDKTIHYKVFSSYTIETEDYYITTNFDNENDYSLFLKTIQKRSVYNYNVNLNVNDKILTLSSCYSNSKKIVVHAKRLD